MTLTELVPRIQQLRRADKLRLMQLLIVELAQEDGISLLMPKAEYPVWTPLNATEAADTLLQVLNDSPANS